MLQYIMTGLAGIVLGIVVMRVWQARAAPDVPTGPGAPLVGDHTGQTPSSATPSTRTILIVAVALVAAAIVLFAFRSPDSAESVGPTTALAAGSGAAGNLADVDTMIAGLAQRLKDNPKDAEGFRMLGWSYVMTGRPKEAIAPYKRALELSPDRAVVHAGYGEALVAVAGDKVTPEAKAAFDKAVLLDPAEPRARHFLALWKAQNGQEKAALDEWIALANGGVADAPWQGDVRRRIDESAKELGLDVSSRLKHPATVATVVTGAMPDPAAARAISAMPEAQRNDAVDNMVEGLAARLAKNPSDVDGWVMLLRSRMVLKQADQAKQDLVAARKSLAGNAAGLAKVETAAAELRVPGA